MPDTGKERREGPDWFATLCEQAEQLGERLNHSSTMDTIGEAEAELEEKLTKAREEWREEARNRSSEAERLVHEHVDCTCLWDLDEDHPDFADEEAEEPLKITRRATDCPRHMILDSLTKEGD